MLQYLTEDDSDQKVLFCEWALDKFENGPGVPSTILFSDVANFYVNREDNKHNIRYDSIHIGNKMQGRSWCVCGVRLGLLQYIIE